MSILPYFLDDYHHPRRPSRLLDQHFGMGLDSEDLLMPFIIPQEGGVMRRPHIPHSYLRPWRSQAAGNDGGSEISMDKDKFQVNLDVQHFHPEEITVKVTGDNTITVEGKHEEKQDDHGFISRQFVRRYVLPKGHDVEHIASKLSSDGVLTITAPKVDAPALEGRKIAIEQTGAPSKAVAVEPKKK